MMYIVDISGIWLFEIQGSVPAEDKTRRQYRQNITCHIVSDSEKRAIEIFYETYPDAAIHSFTRRQRTANVIIDPELFNKKVGQ